MAEVAPSPPSYIAADNQYIISVPQCPEPSPTDGANCNTLYIPSPHLVRQGETPVELSTQDLNSFELFDLCHEFHLPRRPPFRARMDQTVGKEPTFQT
jgi:hypothetical protein